MNIAIIGIGCGFGGYAAYNLLTSGLSDTFGLHTFRHGTGPRNHLSILWNGARPDLGGEATGEATLYEGYTHTKRKFFVWNDHFNREGDVCHPSRPLIWLLNRKIAYPLIKRVGPKFYCIQGGIAGATFKHYPAPLRIFIQILGGIAGFFTPVLDFHVTPKEVDESFNTDDRMVPVAKYTEQPLKSYKYIGLSGVLYQGLNSAVFARIKQDPARFVKGIAKLAVTAALVFSILSILSIYAHIPGLINIYSLIAHATTSSYLLMPLSAGCGIAIPFISLAIS